MVNITTFKFTIPDNIKCQEQLRDLIFEISQTFFIVIAMLILCNGSHFFLKPYSQPRITSDIVVGLIVGNLHFVQRIFRKYRATLENIVDFGMLCYMFVLGIEMDPNIFLKRPTRHVKIAYAGVITTFLLSTVFIPVLRYIIQNPRLIFFTTAISILVASTDSAVLTRLITQLKIGKSDIGKLVIAAGMHSDFVCSITLSIAYILMPLPQLCNDFEKKINYGDVVLMGCAVLFQVVFTLTVSPFLMNWADNENPEGRSMKGPHLVLSVAYMAITCAFPTLLNYSPILSAFLTGVCIPRQGRVSKWVIAKINYILNTIFFPIFFLWMGFKADYREFHLNRVATYARLIILLLLSITGKVVGTVVSGRILGFQHPESVAIGMLLTTKGHLHIYLALKLIECGAVTINTSIVIIVVIFITATYTPMVVAQIIKRAKERAPTRLLALQSLDPSSELRILLCVNGPHNAPAFINFAEISKGAADPGILIYVTDMIELTDEISATLEGDEGVLTDIVEDREINEMREKVTTAFQTHMQESGEGITLKRTMVLSTINNMPRDISVMAEDLMVSLIILPFHRTRRQDGTLDGGNQGFRYVNRKVLRSSPCSVGILVDRGLGSLEGISSRDQVTLNVAVIFIGGKDDREALAYASRVAQHPGVKLTVVRFLEDTTAEASRLVGYRIILPEQEKEMKLDDECFAHFYEKHVIRGRISYTEKHLANAAETFSILKTFEEQYSLVIVGREGGVNSILTRGMNDWQQCPELGPIGDVLSGPDFSMTVSVLIIQQHVVKGEIDGLDDEFSVMSYKY